MIQERTNSRMMSSNPVAVTRAFAKARMGDETALRWLIEQHQAGNSSASKALADLERLLPKAGGAFVA